jgi:hypothetical protein
VKDVQLVHSEIGDYEPLLALAMTRAFNDFNRDCKAAHPIFGVTTKACGIHDYTMAHVTEIFRGNRTVSVQMSQGLFTLMVGGEYCIRFNKLSSELRPCLNGTSQTDFFVQQMPVIEGLAKPVVNLTAGYRSDVTGSTLVDLWLLCHNGPDRFHFMYKIDPPADSQLVRFEPLRPINPAAETGKALPLKYKVELKKRRGRKDRN